MAKNSDIPNIGKNVPNAINNLGTSSPVIEIADRDDDGDHFEHISRPIRRVLERAFRLARIREIRRGRP
jgi:hypothetical protein